MREFLYYDNICPLFCVNKDWHLLLVFVCVFVSVNYILIEKMNSKWVFNLVIVRW